MHNLHTDTERTLNSQRLSARTIKEIRRTKPVNRYVENESWIKREKREHSQLRTRSWRRAHMKQRVNK